MSKSCETWRLAAIEGHNDIIINNKNLGGIKMMKKQDFIDDYNIVVEGVYIHLTPSNDILEI